MAGSIRFSSLNATFIAFVRLAKQQKKKKDLKEEAEDLVPNVPDRAAFNTPQASKASQRSKPAKQARISGQQLLPQPPPGSLPTVQSYEGEERKKEPKVGYCSC